MTKTFNTTVDTSVDSSVYTLLDLGLLTNTVTLSQLPKTQIASTTYSFFDIGQDLKTALDDSNVITAIQNLINQISSSTSLVGYCGAVDQVSIALMNVMTQIYGTTGYTRNRIQISGSDGVLLYDSRFGPNGGNTGISDVYLTEGGKGVILNKVKLKNSPDSALTTNLFGLSSRNSYLGYIDTQSNPGNGTSSFFNSNFTFNANTRIENNDAMDYVVGYNSRISGTNARTSNSSDGQQGSYVAIKVPLNGTFTGEKSCYKNVTTNSSYTGDCIIIKHNYFA